MTSTKLVQGEIARFLRSRDPEVLCVSGAWGVGKTFTWQQMLQSALQEDAVPFDRYSYVSLFGIDSLDGLKRATVENMELLVADTSDDVVAKGKKGLNWAAPKFHKLKDLAAELPYIGELIKAGNAFYFSAIQEQIVCIDDLDRRGADLDMTDVLGLVTFLKEQRRCKVVLLLNDNALGDGGTTDFANYFEKVIDSHLRFAPAPTDSVRIALPGTDSVSELIGARCVALRISNIRIIKKIERFVRMVEPLLANFEPEIFHQAVTSLTLLTWSKYQPTAAPSLEYLRSKKVDLWGLKEEEEIPPQEAAWNTLLQDYGFSWMDDFDDDLLGSIENGFFDPDVIREHAARLDTKIKEEKESGSFDAAFDSFRDSFDDNRDEVLDTIYTAFKRTVRSISHSHLALTIGLFRGLERADQADELIKHYVENRKEPRGFWRLEGPFPERVDPAIVSAFNEKYASFKTEFDVGAVLTKISNSDSWSSEDLQALAAIPIDDYYKLFKVKKGKELRRILGGALTFRRMANATDEMMEMTRRVRLALERIGSESDINARRVKAYGIDVRKA